MQAIPRPTGPLVLAIALGVTAVAGSAGWLFVKAAPELSPEEGRRILERHFRVEGAPLGFEVRSARRLGKGRYYVTLAPPGGPPADPPPLPFEGEVAEGGGKEGWGGRGGARGGGPRKRTEWEKVVVGEPAPPAEASLLVIENDKERGDRVLEEQFAEVRFKDIERVRADGEAVAIDSGTLDWGPFEADWVQHRHFEKAGGVPTFHDTLRVNLSLGRNARVLYLRWPRGAPGGVAAAEELLAGLRPVQPED